MSWNTLKCLTFIYNLQEVDLSWYFPQNENPDTGTCGQSTTAIVRQIEDALSSEFDAKLGI